MDRKTQIKEKYDLSLTAHTQQVSHRSKDHSAIPNLTWDCPSLICKLKSRPNVCWYRSRPQSLVISWNTQFHTWTKYHHTSPQGRVLKNVSILSNQTGDLNINITSTWCSIFAKDTHVPPAFNVMYLQYWILNIECKCFVVKVSWTGVRSRKISVAFRTQQPASRLLQ